MGRVEGGQSAGSRGLLAAYTTLPVVGIPIASGPLSGVDALLSMVQMPPGVPVGCVGIGSAKNAALYAAEILAVSDPQLREALRRMRAEMARSVAEKDAAIQQQLSE